MTISPPNTTGKLKSLDEAGRNYAKELKTTKPKKSIPVVLAIYLMISAFVWLVVATAFTLPFFGAFAGLLAASSLLSGLLSLRE